MAGREAADRLKSGGIPTGLPGAQAAFRPALILVKSLKTHDV